MKLSEFKAVSVPQEAENPLPYWCSELADPQITADEALAAKDNHATCPWHNGRIKTDPTPSDVDGRVFWCPRGKMYWRYSKHGCGYLKLPPLRYPSGF